MNSDAHCVVNGKRVSLADTAASESLLRWLNRHRLTGSKEGCGDGDCGACTVAMVERRAGAEPRLLAVNSCLLPMGAACGREFISVEHLAAGDILHPVQQALIDHAGSQCGYCTPGFVMSLYCGYHEGQLDDACFEGNLCRCTGYQPIRAAAAELAAHGRDQPPALLAGQPEQASAAASLDGFHNPDSLPQALQLKQQFAAARWIAGATDLGVELSHGKAVAPVLIALDRIAALGGFDIQPERVRIGAAVSLSRLQRELDGLFPALDQMLRCFAGRQVRNRATLGGNLGSASPIGDLLPVLLALDATIECASVAGVRRVAAEQFFLAYRQTALRPDELIVAVELPRRDDLLSAAYKVAKRPTDDISIVAACIAVALDDDRRLRHVRLAYGGMAALPQRARACEDWLLGRVPDADTIAQATAMLGAQFSPLSDHRAGADYRRALCGNLFARFVAEQLA